MAGLRAPQWLRACWASRGGRPGAAQQAEAPRAAGTVQLTLMAADLHLVAEALAAVLAHIGPLARVRAPVAQQVGGDAEALAAVAAGVGPLPGVRALVLHKR